MAWSTQGQLIISASAQQLTSSAAGVETLIVKSLAANDGPVYIGAVGVTAATGYPINPGEEFTIAPAHSGLGKTPKPSDVYAIGTASDVLAWIGTTK